MNGCPFCNGLESFVTKNIDDCGSNQCRRCGGIWNGYIAKSKNCFLENVKQAQQEFIDKLYMTKNNE